MNKELEHRIYSQMPPQQEHNTSGEHCWCEPRIERYPHGDVIIHNDIAEFFEPQENLKGH